MAATRTHFCSTLEAAGFIQRSTDSFLTSYRIHMKHKQSSRAISVGAIFLIVLGLTISQRSQAQTADDEFRSGEVIVEIRPGASVDGINARIGTSTLGRIYGTNFYRLETPKNKKENKFRRRLSKDPDVLSAALNPVVMSPISLFGRSTVGFPGGHP